MNHQTANYLQRRFKEYYLMASMEAPPSLASREWGFIFYDQGGMRRHRAFSSRTELVDYIRSTVPAHVYHSAAYYDRPGAPTMKEKSWKGADLIFDLDADHLRNAPRSYSEMLAQVKRETLKLLDFLMDDFGFSDQNIGVVFSGGRGYHIHIRDPNVILLASDSRREIVDYLAGRGLDSNRFIHEVNVSGEAGVEKARSLRGPAADDPGWGGRVNRAIQAFVLYLRDMERPEASALLASIEGIGPKRANTFIQQIEGHLVMDKIRDGKLDFFKGASGIWRLILPYLEEEGIQLAPFMDEMRGETDEPVTADVKRLIRFPDSLHGGSGFRVTPLTLDSLRLFDPLKDAVVFGDESVLVEVIKPFRTEILGRSFDLSPGIIELPLYAAVFMMARGVAELAAGRLGKG